MIKNYLYLLHNRAMFIAFINSTYISLISVTMVDEL